MFGVNFVGLGKWRRWPCLEANLPNGSGLTLGLLLAWAFDQSQI